MLLSLASEWFLCLTYITCLNQMVHCLALPKQFLLLVIANKQGDLLRNFSKKCWCSKCKAHGTYQTWELICLHSNCWTINCMIVKKWLLRMCSVTVTLCCWWQGPCSSTKPLVGTEDWAHNIVWLLWCLGCLITVKCFFRPGFVHGSSPKEFHCFLHKLQLVVKLLT